MDALALHDLYRRQGKTPPTVLVSGGANVRSFLERSEIQTRLKAANRVIVASENEKDAETQQITDAAHQKQAKRIMQITGQPVETWRPQPEHGKDLADVNIRQQQTQQSVSAKNTSPKINPNPNQNPSSDAGTKIEPQSSLRMRMDIY